MNKQLEDFLFFALAICIGGYANRFLVYLKSNCDPVIGRACQFLYDKDNFFMPWWPW